MSGQVLMIVGTRPEAIKIAPIVLAMREARCGLKPIVCLTGQHPRIARAALEVFGVEVDKKLSCVPQGGDLCVTAARVIEAVGRMIDDCGPDAVLVQGDTLSAYAGGLAAALRGVPLAHVEAGLRSGSMSDPFPEELSRRQLSHLATWNFAPTQRAALNLAAEGIPGERIYQVGNTVIDALRLVRKSARVEASGSPGDRESAQVEASGSPGDRESARAEARGSPGPRSSGDGKMILVTAHRRESWGEPLRRICAALAQLATRNPRWRFVFSVHPNPKLHSLIERELGDCEAVRLMQSPPYDEWAEHLLGCDLILTDSGGVQEEGCALGKPVLVLRERTERPEAVEAGSSLVVGTRTEMIVRETQRIMHDARAYADMATPRDVFGDGFAARRIVESLCKDLPPVGRPVSSWRDRCEPAASLT